MYEFEKDMRWLRLIDGLIDFDRQEEEIKQKRVVEWIYAFIKLLSIQGEVS